MTKPIKAWRRWIEVTDYGLEPRQHGEYSNKKDRIFGKAIEVRITPIIKTKSETPHLLGNSEVKVVDGKFVVGHRKNKWERNTKVPSRRQGV